MKWLKIALVTLIGFGGVVSVWAQRLVSNELLQVTLELMDGSRLVGTPDLKSLHLQTADAKLDVPLARLASVVFEGTDRTALVSLQNGDRLTGQVPAREIKLQTIFGMVAVPVAKVVRINLGGGGCKMEGLVLHYTFEQMTNDEIPDESGRGSTGKASHCQLMTEGKIGHGLQFGEANSCVTFAEKDLPTGNAVRSVAMWLKVSSASHHQILFFYGKHVPDSSVYMVLHANSSVLAPGNCGGQNETRGKRAVDDNKWHHATLVYDGENTVKVYVDGELDSTTARAYVTTHAENGSLSWLEGAGHNFEGALDEFMVFDRALSAEEIKRLYDSQK